MEIWHWYLFRLEIGNWRKILQLPLMMDSFHCLCVCRVGLLVSSTFFSSQSLCYSHLFLRVTDMVLPVLPPQFSSLIAPLRSTDKLLPASANPLQTHSYSVVNVKTHPRAPWCNPSIWNSVWHSLTKAQWYLAIYTLFWWFILQWWPFWPAKQNSVLMLYFSSHYFFREKKGKKRKTHHLLKEMQCWIQWAK